MGSVIEEGLETLGLQTEENADCTRLSCESLNGDEVNLQGEDQCHSPSFQPQSIYFSTDHEPNEDKEMIEELKVGMEFSSDESAYNAYFKYGRKNGFHVRKQDRRKSKKGIVKKLVYCCSKEGFKRQREGTSYSLPASRTGCEAHMACQLQINGKFKIVAFNSNHNHDLIRTPMKHMQKINRSMSKAQKAHADDADMSGIPIKASLELMSREVGGRENLGFTNNDYWNYIHRKQKKKLEKGDAWAILQYFQKMQAEDPSFFYAIQLDEDDMITNLFWADARSISDYGLFGDVVCFDTTYHTNEYGRPFAPFVGVNHHKQTVVFGAALLYDETICSFIWLFQTFLGAMSGKKPQTILTDQSAAMAHAISDVFPGTHHRLCVWHIYQNAAKNLSNVFHTSSQFASDFGMCVYDYDEEDEWLAAWNNMLEHYQLKENTWLQELFSVKERWALVYGRHSFTADMMSTQRSESMNSMLKNYLKPGHDLLRFFEHYERALEDRRYEELKFDFRMMHTTPEPIIDTDMLQHAVEVYTPEVFELFQKQYMGMLNCSIYKVGKSGGTCEYKVSFRGKNQEHMVKFDASTQSVTCSCMKFTFVGILCSHSLKVLDKKNVKMIPPDYILNRWTRDAKARSMTTYYRAGDNDNPKELIGKRYSHLCHNFREIASFAAEHEELTVYAHERSVELLETLEVMKKKLNLNDTCAKKISEREVLFGGSEQVNVRGIKRKATDGRPCGRL